MSTTQERRAHELFKRALDVDTKRRDAFLARECGGDSDLRTEVDELLTAHHAMGDFLTHSAATRVSPPELEPGDRVGDYEITRKLGAGGGGTVYEARQKQPNRLVALKVAHVGIGSTGARRRFKEEAEILARLDHPDIAHVYDAGVHEGVPYFVMELVSDALPITSVAGDRLRRFTRVCDAIQHGHQKGVIHRDLKPSNVLVKSDGRLKVIDFGIARMGEKGGVDIAGTLPYMSPEQFDDGDLDVRTDVYALGVLLHELLTGKHPIDLSDRTFPEACSIVRERPPDPLGGPEDLGAIVSKALAKDREARYASAGALAEDVRRFLSHSPVDAYPGGVVYQTRKFARRNRIAFFAAVAVLAVSVTAAVIAGRLAVQREEQRQAAEFQAYVANMSAAYAAQRAADVGEARLRLDQAPEHLRNWEWHYLAGRLDSSLRTVVAVDERIQVGDTDHEGRRIATTGRALRVWDGSGTLQWERPLGTFWAAFHPAGTEIAVVGAKNEASLWDAATGTLRRKWTPHRNNLRSLAYDPSGTRLASASYDGTVKIWSAKDASLLRTLSGESHMHIAVFSPDGARIAAGGVGKKVRIWDTGTGETVAVLKGHRNFIEDVAFSPDGGLLVSGDMDGVVCLWDLESGTRRERCSGHTQFVKAVAFSPDGLAFASAGGDRTVRVWSTADGREIARHVGHTAEIYGLSTHPKGVISFSIDGQARIWATAPHDPVRTVQTAVARIRAVTFGPEGKRIALGGDAEVQLRDGRSLALLERGEATRGVRDLCFLEDAEVLMVGGALEFTSAEPVSTWRGVGSPVRTPRGATACADYPFGRVLCSGTALELFDRRGSRSARWPLKGHGTSVAARGWKQLAVGYRDGSVGVWDGTPLARARPFRVHVSRIAIDPEGRRIAAIGDRLLLLNGRTLETVAELKGHAGTTWDVAFSPDGTRLASGGQDGTVRLWDAETGAQVAVLQGRTDRIMSVAWSPDGSRIVAGTQQGELKLWSR